MPEEVLSYRLSEDLDFTLRGGRQIDQRFLGRLFRQVLEWVSDESG